MPLPLLAQVLTTGPTLPPWRPFLVPIPLGGLWPLTVLPLVVAIAVVYKALKLDDVRQWPGQILRLTGQILAFMVLAAVAIWLVTKIM
jgi:hypothetical protein